MKNYPVIIVAALTVVCLSFIFNLNKRVNRLEGFFGPVGPDEVVPIAETNTPKSNP